MAIKDYVDKQVKKVTQKVGSLFDKPVRTGTPAQKRGDTGINTAVKGSSLPTAQQLTDAHVKRNQASGVSRATKKGSSTARPTKGSKTTSDYSGLRTQQPVRGVTNSRGEFLAPGSPEYIAEMENRQEAGIPAQKDETLIGGMWEDDVLAAESQGRTDLVHAGEWTARQFGEDDEAAISAATTPMNEKLLKAQAKEKSRLQAQIDEANRRDQRDKDISDRTIESQMAGTTASFAQDREGAMSMTTPMLGDKTNAIFQERMDESQIRMDTLMNQREQAMTDLDEAQAQGRADSAEAHQDRINYINRMLSQEKAAQQQTQIEASQENRAAQAAMEQSLGNYTSLVNSGVELTPAAIQGFANSYGMDSALASEYYMGAQAIRDSKNLSLEEQQLKLDDLNYDYNEKQLGIVNDDIRNANYITQMYKDGKSQEEISRMKESLHMTDTDDPVYQLDLRIKAAEAQMKENQMNGIPTTFSEHNEYNQMMAEQAMANGGTGTYVPDEGNNAPYSTTVNADGSITVNVEEGTRPVRPGGRTAYQGQCAAWVNDMTGTKMSNSYESKMEYVNPSIQVPAAGMFFVENVGQYGHTGIVEKVNADGTVNIISSNARGNEQIVREYNQPLSRFSGFGEPPNATHVGGSAGMEDAAEYTDAQQNIINKMSGYDKLNSTDLKILEENGLTSGDVFGFEQEEKEGMDFVPSELARFVTTADKDSTTERVQNFIDNNDMDGLKHYSTSLVVDDLPAKAQNQYLERSNIVTSGNQLIKLMEEYEAEGGDTGIFNGTSTKIRNSLNMSSPKQAVIGQAIILNLEKFERAQSGAAIGEEEIGRFEDMLPSMFDDKKLASAKIMAFAMSQENETRTLMQQKLSVEAFNSIWGDDEGWETQVFKDIEKMEKQAYSDKLAKMIDVLQNPDNYSDAERWDAELYRVQSHRTQADIVEGQVSATKTSKSAVKQAYTEMQNEATMDKYVNTSSADSDADDILNDILNSL